MPLGIGAGVLASFGVVARVATGTPNACDAKNGNASALGKHVAGLPAENRRVCGAAHGANALIEVGLCIVSRHRREGPCCARAMNKVVTDGRLTSAYRLGMSIDISISNK